jgi:hypothetical protein
VAAGVGAPSGAPLLEPSPGQVRLEAKPLAIPSSLAPSTLLPSPSPSHARLPSSLSSPLHSWDPIESLSTAACCRSIERVAVRSFPLSFLNLLGGLALIQRFATTYPPYSSTHNHSTYCMYRPPFGFLLNPTARLLTFIPH